MFLKNNKIRTKNKHRGFSLIEILVGFSILMIIIVTLMSLASQSIAVVNFSRDQSVASFLAQDAVEFIANRIEENKNNGVDWLNGLRFCGVGNVCIIDTTRNSTPFAWICAGACPVLRYNDGPGVNEGRFAYGGGGAWQDTTYTRAFSVSEFPSADEVAVTVTVDWVSTAATRQLINKKNIFR